MARSAVELHRCSARVSRAAALVQQHIDGVARASSTGTKSGSTAHSLVLLTMLAPVSRSARLEDQLGLDDESNSEIADGYATGSSARHGVAVGDLPTSSASAVQLVLQYKRVPRRRPPYSRNVATKSAPLAGSYTSSCSHAEPTHTRVYDQRSPRRPVTTHKPRPSHTNRPRLSTQTSD